MDTMLEDGALAGGVWRAAETGTDFAVIDPASGREIARVQELLRDLQDKFDLAILFITRDLRVLAQISDEIAMRKGEIVERGPASRVLTAPEHPYTRALIAAAPGRGAV